MHKQNKMQATSIQRNTSYKGETIEEKVARITQNKEPIKDGAPLIYTERKMGVQAAYDIRTDRFEVAADAMDKIHKINAAKKEATMGEKAKDGMKEEAKTETKNDGGTKPADNTSQEGK